VDLISILNITNLVLGVKKLRYIINICYNSISDNIVTNIVKEYLSSLTN